MGLVEGSGRSGLKMGDCGWSFLQVERVLAYGRQAWLGHLSVAAVGRMLVKRSKMAKRRRLVRYILDNNFFGALFEFVRDKLATGGEVSVTGHK